MTLTLRSLCVAGILTLVAVGGPARAEETSGVIPAPVGSTAAPSAPVGSTAAPSAPVGSTAAPSAPDSEGFERVDGNMMRGESIPASGLVAAAYGFIFGAVVLYVVAVARRTRRVEEELEELTRRVDQAGR
jgi:hypothetical protein